MNMQTDNGRSITQAPDIDTEVTYRALMYHGLRGDQDSHMVSEIDTIVNEAAGTLTYRVYYIDHERHSPTSDFIEVEATNNPVETWLALREAMMQAEAAREGIA